MLISTCGFGNTGASAVLDFLQGYPDLQRIANFEFQLLHMADGINDLKYHLTVSRERVACNSAIKRFERAAIHGHVGERMRKLCGNEFEKLTKAYIKNLVIVSWLGGSGYDPIDTTNYVYDGFRHSCQIMINRCVRKLNNKYHYPPRQRRYLSVMTEGEFDEITSRYLIDCFRAVGLDPEKDILTDVLFSAMNPQMGTEFVKDPKIILVFRDPRDMYIRANEHQSTNGHTPCTDVDAFIQYYSSLMRYRKPYKDALEVQYEDLIYHYYPTTKKIMDFLGFDIRPTNEFKYFNPDISVKYTKAWETYRGHELDKEKIENALDKYLFDYEEYIPVSKQKELYEGVR